MATPQWPRRSGGDRRRAPRLGTPPGGIALLWVPHMHPRNQMRLEAVETEFAVIRETAVEYLKEETEPFEAERVLPLNPHFPSLRELAPPLRPSPLAARVCF